VAWPMWSRPVILSLSLGPGPVTHRMESPAWLAHSGPDGIFSWAFGSYFSQQACQHLFRLHNVAIKLLDAILNPIIRSI
jgi:quinol-cytochrome oxidoreductase complex cytochrome b subunit